MASIRTFLFASALTGLTAPTLVACGHETAPTNANGPATTGASVGAASSSAKVTEFPSAGRNLYALDLPLTDDHGAQVKLDRFRGHPVLVAMFYASCPKACPLLVSDILSIDESLSAAAHADVRVLLVSFDPDADDPEHLHALRLRRQLDEDRWGITVATHDDARTLAAALDVRYRSDKGGFLHSSVITLVDRDGRIDARVESGGEAAKGPLRDLAARVEALAAAR